MTKRLCFQQQSCSWPPFLIAQLRSFVDLQGRKRLSATCRRFNKLFRSVGSHWYDVSKLFGSNRCDQEIQTYIEDVDRVFANAAQDVDWPADREHWERVVRMIRRLRYRAAGHSAPPLWNQVPILENLSDLDILDYGWFAPVACAEKLPNLTALTLVFCFSAREFDFSSWRKLRRLSLRNDGPSGKISIDLSPATCDLMVDTSFVVRSGSETVERLTLTDANDRAAKFVLSAPAWPSLTLLTAMSPLSNIWFSDGHLPRLHEFAFEHDPTQRCDLLKLFKAEQLATLYLPAGSVSDVLVVAGQSLTNLQELMLELPVGSDLESLVAVRSTLKRLHVWTSRKSCRFDMQSIGQLTRLESLRINAYSRRSCQVELRYLENCQELRHLSVRGMLDATFPGFSFYLPKLETLSLSVKLKAFFELTEMVPGLPNNLRRLTLGCKIRREESMSKLLWTLRTFRRLEWLDLSEIRGKQPKSFVRGPTRAVELDNWLSPNCAVVAPRVDD